MLGLRRRGATFGMAPCVASAWASDEITWTLADTAFHITVNNLARVSRGVDGAWLDGLSVDPEAIPIVPDGARHEGRMVVGPAR